MLIDRSVRRWTLITTIMASSLVFIDGTALNVALPAIQEDMELSGAQLLWVVNAFTLFLSAFMLIGGALGDQYGRNRIFSAGILLFILASLSCGISLTPAQLIVSRAIQGAGGALMVPGSLSIITAQFPREKAGGAIGVWSTFSALTTVLGPILGGWLAGIGWWRAIFFINIPIALFVLWSVRRHVPETRNEQAVKLDITGALLAVAGLGGITYGFIEAGEKGFGNPSIVVSLVIGGACSIAFLLSQYHGKHPMMPLQLFKITDFSIINTATFLIYGGMGAILFFLPLNLVQIQGYTEVQTGLSVLPVMVLITLFSPVTGRIYDRTGARIFLSTGPVITGTGFLLFGFQGITSGAADYWNTFFLPSVLLGLGMGLTVAPLTSTVMLSVSKNNSGIASGVNNTISRIAGVLFIALLGAMVLTHFRQSLIEPLYELGVPSGTIDILKENAVDLGNTQPPETTPARFVDTIESLIRSSFVKSFNRVAWIAAGSAWLSAILCFTFLRRNR